MEPVLVVKDIVKHFGGLTAVDHVTLEVYPNEVVGLVGDNGAGKSTLIKMIAGVHQPNGGEIYFEGHRVKINTPSAARDMGIETIYQDLALAGNLDLSANIFLGREAKKRYLGGLIHVLDEKYMLDASKRSLSVLDIHIASFTEEIDKLSGGQRQAVAIARAHHWHAKLMIMDEPTNNLGVTEQRKVLEVIRTLRRQKVPVILISHTLPEVFSITDRIVVMHRGRKVADKRTAETTSQEIVEYMMGVLDDTRGP